MKVCQTCGSDRVQELLAVWFRANDDQRMVDIAEDLSPIAAKCDECESEAVLIEVEDRPGGEAR